MAGGTCRALGDSPLPRVIAPRCRACGCSRARACAPYQRILFMFVFGLSWSCCPRAEAQFFTTKAIGQSNPAAGASNTITVTLVADATLAAADSSKVTLSGLDGAVASSPITLLDAGDDGETIFSDGTTQGKGAWDSGTLTLTVNSSASLKALTNYTFKFQITNPTSATTSPTINITASGTAAIASAAMTKPGAALYGVANGADPLRVVVPSFSLKSIRQSTPGSGATNTLTVALTADFDLAAGSTVTITGLTGSQTEDSASLRVSSTSGLLGTSGTWTQASGQLVLTVAAGSGTVSGTGCEVTFNLTNRNSSQASPAVSVSAEIKDGSGNSVGSIASAAMTKMGAALYGVANGTDPLTVVVPSFSTRSIQQSSTSPGTNNSITITLMANYDMATGSTVTITGLTGSLTSENDIPLTSTSDLLGARGAWTRDTGMLVLTAASGGTRAGTACAVTFSLMNPMMAQVSPAVSIQASVQLAGGAVMSIDNVAMIKPETSMCGVEDGANPLTVVVSLSCADGTFPGETRCEPCPAGYFCNRNSTRPMPCPAGTAASGTALMSASQCIICPTGFVALSPGSTNCTACPAGYNGPTASSIGSQCDQGSYSLLGQQSCIICPVGYSCEDPAKEPTRCQVGYFSQAGAASCVQCAAGKFCPVSPASALPMACSDGEYSGNGKTSCSACSPGYFAVARISNNCTLTSGLANCTRCPAGHSCEPNGEDC